jgi:hypothetical protein
MATKWRRTNATLPSGEGVVDLKFAVVNVRLWESGKRRTGPYFWEDGYQREKEARIGHRRVRFKYGDVSNHQVCSVERIMPIEK